MARNEFESRWPTFWQLQAFVAVAKAGDWSDAARRLGGADKHQVLKAIDRLAEKLDVEKLVADISGRPELSPHARSVAERAEEILDAYRVLKREAGTESKRQYWIRCDAFWAHMSQFLGIAIAELEAANEDVTVELRPSFGAQRSSRGAGLVGDLFDKSVDFVIAPAGQGKGGVHEVPLYEWTLVAAVPKRHELTQNSSGRSKTRSKVVGLDSLSEFRLVTSPVGHRSRYMLDARLAATRRFSIEATSPEPSALVALGEGGSRVPVIPSDSVVEWQPHWPVIIDGQDRALGGRYSAYYRETGPERLRDLLEELAQECATRAQPLSDRVRQISPDLEIVE